MRVASGFLLATLVATAACGRHGFSDQPGDAATDGGDAAPAGCVASYTAFGDQVCVVRDDGVVYCWGGNSHGQLGDATFVDRDTPGPALISNVSSIASGEDTVCAVKNDGSLWCWGANDRAQVGDGSLSDRAIPRAISLPGMVAEVRGAEDHTCARLVDGTGYCWGFNSQGQLGRDPPPSPELAPIATPQLDNSAAFTLGDYFTCARDAAGQVTCWGRNLVGELGDGTMTSRSTAGPVVGIPDPVTQVVAGCHEHACARTSTGDVYCWGNNESGQVGKGAISAFETLPVRVTIPAAVQVAVGAFHSCARTASDEVWCWGRNEAGQLGNGTFDDSVMPVRASVTGPFDDIQATCTGTFLRRTDGTLVGWGSDRLFSGGTGSLASAADIAIPCP